MNRPPRALGRLPRIVAFAFALAAAGTLPARAQVFKCAGIGSQPIYQDQPCPPGAELRDFARDPAEVSVIPMHPAGGSSPGGKPAASSRVKPAPASRPAKAIPGNPAERRFIHTGMPQGEVVARIGPPDLKGSTGSRRQVRWTYLPVPGDARTLTTIVFDSGRVVEVERKLMQ